MTATETVVRMGELAAAVGADSVLTTVGLGSCVGLALLDRAGGIAGLAHVVLPEAPGTDAPAQPGKFADTAVPALVAQVLVLGARRSRLEAALVGGAQMFSFGGLDIGSRNESAVRGALESHRIPVRAADTGGSTGRTMHVHPDGGVVFVRGAGQDETALLGAVR